MTSRGLTLRNEDTYDYDFSLTSSRSRKLTFEVKTRRARRKPQYGYVNTISGHNPLQKGDYYVFLRVVLNDSTKTSRVFFTGAKKTSMFRSQSRFVLGGTSVYGLKQDFDCYALRFQDCLSLSEFLREFEPDLLSITKKATFNKRKKPSNRPCRRPCHLPYGHVLSTSSSPERPQILVVDFFNRKLKYLAAEGKRPEEFEKEEESDTDFEIDVTPPTEGDDDDGYSTEETLLLSD